MRNSWKRLASVLLAMAMLAALLPLGSAFAAGAYGKTTGDSVAIRKSASTSGDIWFRVDAGTVATILTTETVKDVTWYKVQLEKPGSGTGNVYVGYVHGDYFRPLTEDETTAWENNPVNTFTATAADGTVVASASNGNGVGTITNGGVNFREQPSLRGGVITQLDRGTTVELLYIPAASDPDPWYQVWYGGHTGYVQGPFVKVVSTGSLTPGVTGAPAVVSVVTAAPAAPVKGTEVTAPMPGTVLRINAEVGQAVKRGDDLIIIEAMKMEQAIKAPADGTVASISVAQGDTVTSGQVVAII